MADIDISHLDHDFSDYENSKVYLEELIDKGLLDFIGSKNQTSDDTVTIHLPSDWTYGNGVPYHILNYEGSVKPIVNIMAGKHMMEINVTIHHGSVFTMMVEPI